MRTGVAFGALGAANVQEKQDSFAAIQLFTLHPEHCQCRRSRGDVEDAIGQVVQIGEQGPIWAAPGCVTSILFRRGLCICGRDRGFSIRSTSTSEAGHDSLDGTPLPPLPTTPPGYRRHGRAVNASSVFGMH